MIGTLLLIAFWASIFHNIDVAAYPEEGYNGKRWWSLVFFTLVCSVIGVIFTPLIVGAFL